MNKQNKTIFNIFIFLNFILKNQIFKINDVLEFFEKRYKIMLRKTTILKYIRTLKFLGFKFKRLDKQVYSLIKIPTYFDSLENQDKYYKCVEIIKNYQKINTKIQNSSIVDKLSRFIQGKLVSSKTGKRNKNMEKIKQFINDGKRVRIYLKGINTKKTALDVEIEDLFLENNIFYIKVFDVVQKEYLIINIDLISQIKQKLIQNKYIYLKYQVELKISRKFANSYHLKYGEEIIKKSHDFVYIKSFFTDKKLFFNNILRYRDNCEIVAPKHVREEFYNYLTDLYQKYDCPNVK